MKKFTLFGCDNYFVIPDSTVTFMSVTGGGTRMDIGPVDVRVFNADRTRDLRLRAVVHADRDAAAARLAGERGLRRRQPRRLRVQRAALALQVRVDADRPIQRRARPRDGNARSTASLVARAVSRWSAAAASDTAA